MKQKAWLDLLWMISFSVTIYTTILEGNINTNLFDLQDCD